MDDRSLARIQFEAHNRSTGGKTYDGRPIPTWDQIADPLDFKNHSPRVIQAWTDAARAGREALELEIARIAGEDFRIGLEALELENPEAAARANGSRYLVGRQSPLIPAGDGTHTLDRTRSDLILHMQPGTPIRPPSGAERGIKR